MAGSEFPLQKRGNGIERTTGGNKKLRAYMRARQTNKNQHALHYKLHENAHGTPSLWSLSMLYG